MASSSNVIQSASKKRTRLVIGALLLLVVSLISVGITYLFIQEEAIAHYPGSQEMSSHLVTNGLSRLHLRRDMSYKSNDDFLDVRRWYRKKFDLDYATRETHSNCVMLEGMHELLWFRRHMNVMVCSHERFQTVFVKRSLYVQTR